MQERRAPDRSEEIGRRPGRAADDHHSLHVQLGQPLNRQPAALADLNRLGWRGNGDLVARFWPGWFCGKNRSPLNPQKPQGDDYGFHTTFLQNVESD
jgi:hypothetical protein